MEDESIWCRINVSDVSDVLDEYTLWKDDPWYHSVEWQRVIDQLDDVLQEHAVDGQVEDLIPLLQPAERELAGVNAEGLAALAVWPITVMPVQLVNGGHRLNAMRLQGVARVPGMFVRGDVGYGVRPEQIYPIKQA